MTQSLKAFLFIALVSCASYTEQTESVRRSYYMGDNELALSKLEKSDLKTDHKSKLLYHLEKSSILDRLGRFDQQRQELFTADKVAADLFSVSITNTAQTFILSERSADYAGEDFEKVAIHIMLALSFIEEKNFNAALIEARKINNVLKEITKDYESNNNSYNEDAFARLLSGIIYEALGQSDDAIIDYRKAYQLYNSKGFRNFCDEGGAPSFLVKSMLNLATERKRKDLFDQVVKENPSAHEEWLKTHFKSKSHGELIVIHQQGSIAIKRAKEFILPFGRQIVRFSFPYYPEPASFNSYVGFTGVKLNNGFAIEGSNVSNLDRIAYQTLEDRRGRLIAKSAARLIAKGQLNEQARQNFGPLGGLLANIFTAATETADTRSWTLLPKRFYITRLSLPVGEHHVQLLTDGRLSQILDLKVESGSKIMVRASG